MKSKLRKALISIILIGLLFTLVPTWGLAENGEVPSADLSELFESGELTEEEVKQIQNHLPGNFFYFVNTALEDLQMKLAFSDYSKALLLAQFAQERLKAAQTLVEAGYFNEAEGLLEDAIHQYVMSNNFNEERVVVIVDDPVYESHEALDTVNDNSDLVIEDNMKENLDDKELHTFPQAVISLWENAEKIENPNAVSALKRNIERKLSKRNIDPALFFGIMEGTEDLEVNSVENGNQVFDRKDETDIDESVVASTSIGQSEETVISLRSEKNSTNKEAVINNNKNNGKEKGNKNNIRGKGNGNGNVEKGNSSKDRGNKGVGRGNNGKNKGKGNN
ncbi:MULTISPECIES: DUF5667 domain-containing protein [Bacillaceae]|uniref:DUF5667 domain-containing protein n=1 Tax=Evansella alkalicola TaxID=745819 RepID=A0ABS6JZ72_9BACI|nr:MULTISPECIES: DUF5667 domain-containing protein [Bacillaceae]MBU9723883.1 hypothetical protein [Bacillus alkalicola]